MKTLKTLKYTATNDKSQNFEIRDGGNGVGFYFFVYENGKCIRDHLQDTLEKAKSFAQRYFNVPESAWKKVDE
jgi:hypothetical protein